jgi:hypothetical protein
MSQAVNMDLPVKTGDDFIGELETMDLSELKSKTFMVAVSNGDRSGVTFVCSTIRGPYTFEEMCESLGVMWEKEQHHGKAIVCQKDPSAKPMYLDQNTVDYIEAHFKDIITESLLDGVFDEQKDYTCRANIIEGDNKDNPMAPENRTLEKAKEAEEDDSL